MIFRIFRADTPRLHTRLQEAGWPIGTVLTMFDFVDLDEELTSGSRWPVK
jgi:hypothetical protein